MYVYVYIYTEREIEKRGRTRKRSPDAAAASTPATDGGASQTHIPSDITQNTQILQENNENSSTQISGGGDGKTNENNSRSKHGNYITEMC